MRWKRGLRQNPFQPMGGASVSQAEPVTHFFSSSVGIVIDAVTDVRIAKHLVSSVPIVFELSSNQFIPFEGETDEVIMAEIALFEEPELFRR